MHFYHLYEITEFYEWNSIHMQEAIREYREYRIISLKLHICLMSDIFIQLSISVKLFCNKRSLTIYMNSVNFIFFFLFDIFIPVLLFVKLFVLKFDLFICLVEIKIQSYMFENKSSSLILLCDRNRIENTSEYSRQKISSVHDQVSTWFLFWTIHCYQ